MDLVALLLATVITLAGFGGLLLLAMPVAPDEEPVYDPALERRATALQLYEENPAMRPAEQMEAWMSLSPDAGGERNSDR